LLNPAIRGFVTDALAPLTLNQGFGLMLQRRLVDSFATLFPAGVIGLAVGLGVGALTPNPPFGRPGGRGESPHPLSVGDANAGQRPGEGGLCSPALLMALSMILTGALLMLGPEFVYLRDNFGTRMNTLFKFYFQTWTLWALASAFGLWYIWQLARPTARRVAAGAMSLATLAGLVYTFPALYSKTGHFAGPPTLDGMAYFAEQYPDDWAAIQWVEQNVPGAPVLAEGIGGQYWIEGRFSRISMATGLPTVMGWPGHEGQWRGHYIERVVEREGQIQALYQARDWATAQKILDDYDIEYVYVSALEQDKYRPVYLPKFDQHMRAVFQSGDVTIYQRLDSQAN
ncbi:MAG: DUF2298 domain-containing protein, partial [Anaerolineales bacterium]